MTAIIKLSEVFLRHTNATAVDGEPLMYWSTWTTFLQALPNSITYGIGCDKRAATSIAACANRYGISTLPKPVPLKTGSGRRAATCLTYADVHNVMWEHSLVKPIDAFIKRGMGFKAVRYESRIMTDELWRIAAPIISHGLSRSTASDLHPIDIDQMCEEVCDLIAGAAGVTIDKSLFKEHIAELCQLIEPSLFLAKTLCRCDVVSEVLGEGLSKHARGSLHCCEHGAAMITPQTSTTQTLLQELVETRQELTRFKSAAACGFIGSFDVCVDRSTLIRRKAPCETLSKRGNRTMLKTATLEWAVSSNIAFKNCPESIVGVERLLRLMKTGIASDVSEVMDQLCSQRTIGRHALVLDSALDALMKEKIDKACMLFSHFVVCCWCCNVLDSVV